MVESVAVVGVGAMGGPIARGVRTGGFDLTVCDVSDEALRPFAAEGVKTTTRPADCAACDLVAILVATVDQTRSVLLGEDGVASAVSPERSPLVAVMSTVGRDAILELENSLRPFGVRLVDAPISGGSVRAREGTLSVIMGGDRADVEMARPVMACLGPELFHCGPVGAAQTVKVINNILGMVNTITAAEAYRLAVEHELDLAETTRILDVSTGRNWLSAVPDEAARSFGTFTSTRRAFDSLMAIMRKDASLGLELVSDSDGEFPVIERVATLVNSLGDETFDNWCAVGGVMKGSTA
jgi:3-hydroxyisobutyrate dehydrogenase